MKDVPTIKPETDLASLLAINMRDLREAAKMTVKEAAKRAGMHWSFWEKLEKEEGLVRSHMLRRIADALQVEPAALIEVPLTLCVQPQANDAPVVRSRRAHAHLLKRKVPNLSPRTMRPFTRTHLATRRPLTRNLLMWTLALTFQSYLVMAAKRQRDRQ